MAGNLWCGRLSCEGLQAGKALRGGLTHLLVVLVIHTLRKDITIQGLAALVHRRLAPATWLEAKGCPWRDGCTQAWHLQAARLVSMQTARGNYASSCSPALLQAIKLDCAACCAVQVHAHLEVWVGWWGPISLAC